MELLITLPVGVTLQLLLFVLLRAFGGFAAKPAAVLVALLALALYLPYAVLDWPGGDVVGLHVAIYLVTAYALGLIVANREARLATHGGGRGWFHWGPAGIIAFFVVLVLFDGVLVVIASRGLPGPLSEVLLPRPRVPGEQVTSAFPGVVSRDYQKQQLRYNAFLEQMRRQQARGWVVHKGWLGGVRAGQPGLFQVKVLDRNGRPLTGAEVQGVFMRPSDTRRDVDFRMTETGPGVYRVELSLPLPGNWDLELEIRRGDDLHHLRATTRVEQ
ncbi:FixH family protein [Thiohalobacter sp. IOR34]|uniref:FixH family protein n=1 Tax=Thiohalobacter sp. IOR34 TaxID=3057176 RepID=UPI0025AF3BE0|nr:FixH family protein [Thiohalobacter sp. IOR34]WJW75734.1 FixH family protein [Thiohalobacter sp. IOR34]